MTGEELRAGLTEQRISTRQLAAELEVSAMWVSRRMTGEVPISDDDATAIRGALGAITRARVSP